MNAEQTVSQRGRAQQCMLGSLVNRENGCEPPQPRRTVIQAEDVILDGRELSKVLQDLHLRNRGKGGQPSLPFLVHGVVELLQF